MGADLCGIADPKALCGAPKGFHPFDVMPECKSVIVIAQSFPAATLACPHALGTKNSGLCRNEYTFQEK